MRKLPEMPLLTISSPETIEKCSNLMLRENDIFICSYPKSGTTWSQHIVISLLLLAHRKKRNVQQLPYEHVSDYAPFLEIDPHWDGSDLTKDIQLRHALLGRRVFNTHLRGDMLPGRYVPVNEADTGDNNLNTGKANANANAKEISTHPKAKFIYIIRSPLDVCVSFYHHLSNQEEGCYEQSLKDFFLAWMQGEIPFGSWTDHVRSYAPFIQRKDVLLLSFEDMVNDLSGCVQRLTKFLELDECLNEDDIGSVLPSFTFESMKKNLNKFQPKSVTWKRDFKFLRKGEVGDNKIELTDEERTSFYKKLKEENVYDEIKLIFGGDDVTNPLERYLTDS